jgi:hypothetical protein
VNAVHVALLLVDGDAEDLQRSFQRRGKPGKRAADRMHRALQDLHRASCDPNLPDDLRSILPDDPARWIEDFKALRVKAGKKRFHYKAQKRLVAAEAAYRLLQQFFNGKITAEKGSVFCRLSALFCGEHPDRLQWTCRGVASRAQSTAVLRSENIP